MKSAVNNWLIPNALALGFWERTQVQAFSLEKTSHLMDPSREGDDPIPINKSFFDILNENWWVVAIIAGILLLFVFGLWLVRRYGVKNVGEHSIKRDPYEEAHDALQKLESQLKTTEAKPFTFRLSEVLRIYVERRFEFPAMELTGEEFLREVAKNDFFRQNYNELLHEFIVRSDIVKYSREVIDQEGLRSLLESARHFVKDTHQRLEEEKEQNKALSKQEAA